jgi:hypothetical protein
VIGDEIFEDKVLAAGDCLQIGGAELEVLSDTMPGRRQSPAVLGADATAYVTRLESLERQLAELQRNADVDSKATLHLSDNSELLATRRPS